MSPPSSHPAVTDFGIFTLVPVLLNDPGLDENSINTEITIKPRYYPQ